MHELGIMFSVVKTVENFAKQNGLKKIDTIVLQIGELSPVVPMYIEECYAPAVDGTMLQETKLKIEMVPGNGYCKKCNTVFNVLSNQGICPKCGNKSFEELSGKEFNIKEIVAC